MLKNRPPRWNAGTPLLNDRYIELNAFVLDFKGKAKIPSVKNFVLTDAGEHDDFLLMGKEEEDLFNLEVKWPVSIYQAFAIAISSIEK